MIARIRGAVWARVQCWYCKAWFDTDRALSDHLKHCGY